MGVFFGGWSLGLEIGVLGVFWGVLVYVLGVYCVCCLSVGRWVIGCGYAMYVGRLSVYCR